MVHDIYISLCHLFFFSFFLSPQKNIIPKGFHPAHWIIYKLVWNASNVQEDVKPCVRTRLFCGHDGEMIKQSVETHLTSIFLPLYGLFYRWRHSTSPSCHFFEEISLLFSITLTSLLPLISSSKCADQDLIKLDLGCRTISLLSVCWATVENGHLQFNTYILILQVSSENCICFRCIQLSIVIIWSLPYHVAHRVLNLFLYIQHFWK